MEKGYEIFIGGERISQYDTFNFAESLTDFVTSFSLTLGNRGGRESLSIPVGGVINFFFNGIEVFRGIVENKQVELNSIGSSLSLSGREELLLLSETDINPEVGVFKDTTDNEIIGQLLTQFPWELDLGIAKEVKEYDVSGGSTRIAEILDDITKYNDFYLLKKGTTIKKSKIPTTLSDSDIATKFTVTELDGKFSQYNNRVLSMKLVEDITAVRSSVTGYSYEQGKKKFKIKHNYENNSLQDGSYANRLRNESSLQGMAINRTRYVTSPAKDLDELERQTTRSAIDADIKIGVTVEVAGYLDLDVLDIVDVQVEQEKILQYMYVDSIVYQYKSSNMKTTEVTLKPFPYVKL